MNNKYIYQKCIFYIIIITKTVDTKTKTLALFNCLVDFNSLYFMLCSRKYL